MVNIFSIQKVLIQKNIIYTLLCILFFSFIGLYGVYKITSNQEKIKDFLPESHHKKKHISRKGGLVIGVLGVLVLFLNRINTIRFFSNFIFFSDLHLLVSFTGLVSFIVGLVDDIMKKHRGLNNLIRIGVWYSTAGLIVIFRYKIMGGLVCIPLLGIVDLGWFYILFALPFFVGVVNGVNMTDGLDGLVSFPVILNLVFFTIVGHLYYGTYISYMALFLIPVMFSFLIFNKYPAKLFMGDSGAIFLGSTIATLYLLTGLEFFFPIVGFVFTANFFSSFIQVIAINKFGKRIFKIAPLHHHFEMQGYKESTIVYAFWLISLLCTIIGLFIFHITLR